MAETRCNISGDRWNVKVVTEKQMKKIRGPGHEAASGLCVPSEKTIYLDKECVDYATVLHELGHAYFSNLHLDDTNTIPLADVEEIVCSLWAAKGEKMCRQAKRIVKDIRKQLEEN
jgi:hypothetical protein